jgi:hypothetical protein
MLVELDPLSPQPTIAIPIARKTITHIGLCTFPPESRIVATQENTKVFVKLPASWAEGEISVVFELSC